MNWREEYAKSLMTLGNLALVGLVFNGNTESKRPMVAFRYGHDILWGLRLGELAVRP
jgi:hypothetical protein